MLLSLARGGLGLIFSVLGLASALAFGPTGPWDAAPFDNPVRPPASVGAHVASAEAWMNSQVAAGRYVSKPKTSGVQPSCSLSIASPTMPSGTSGSTIVLEANVNAPVIQVCR